MHLIGTLNISEMGLIGVLRMLALMAKIRANA